jgi:hypothetical protein
MVTKASGSATQRRPSTLVEASVATRERWRRSTASRRSSSSSTWPWYSLSRRSRDFSGTTRRGAGTPGLLVLAALW